MRTALWRALHVEVDAPPHVLDDEVGLQLVAPDDGWRDRPDMHPDGTRGFRAAIVARARFVEDLVVEQAAAGVTQYVILGAGLDTVAERRPELGARLRIFEVDQPGTQAWKRAAWRSSASAFPTGCAWCRSTSRRGRAGGTGCVPPASNPTARRSWRRPASACTSTKDTTAAHAAPAGRARSGLDGRDVVPAADRARRRGRPAGLEASARGARASGTPFVSFFTPDEIVTMARDAGFAEVRHVDRREHSPSATSPGEPTGCDPRAART